MTRESLLKLKEQAEAEKAMWIEKLNGEEKAINDAGQRRQELIGRANQAVGAIAAIDKLLEAESGERTEEPVHDPSPNKRRARK